MEEFGYVAVVVFVLTLAVGGTCAVKTVDLQMEARRCTTWYGAAKTAQDSLEVASKGCEWLLVPIGSP